MLVDRKTTDDPSVVEAGARFGAPRSISQQLRAQGERALLKLQRPGDSNPRTFGVVPGPSGGILKHTMADVVNVHWIGKGYLSVPQLARITRPLIWTLHDMWPFCGAEHFTSVDCEARWRQGYRRENRSTDSRGLDLDRYAWLLKRRALRRQVQLVTPSRWLAEQVRSSALFQDWPCAVIPNPVPTDVFHPHPREFARQVMGLPSGVPLVAFGAVGGTRDPNKGWDLLRAALPMVSREVPEARAAIFGQSEPREPLRIGIPVHFVGRLNDNTSLALLYSAVDVMVVPSRLENLPQTATEAQACGTPVVVFGSTGTRETVSDGITGRVVPRFDSGELAAALVGALTNVEWASRAGDLARLRAEAEWAPHVVAVKFKQLAAESLRQFSG
jgi:glycosyltransferase involved in cell wall biosynthesis